MRSSFRQRVGVDCYLIRDPWSQILKDLFSKFVAIEDMFTSYSWKCRVGATQRLGSVQQAARIALVTYAAIASIGAHARNLMDDGGRPIEHRKSAIAVHVDNDFLLGRGRDRDYSWGLAVTLPGDDSGWTAPLEMIRRRLDPGHWKSEENPDHSHRAVQLGLYAMTPQKGATGAQADGERPYASFLYVTRSALSLNSTQDAATYTGLTIGVLGLNIAPTIQNATHRLLGNERRSGWDEQISKGGELTGRYVVARQYLSATSHEAGRSREFKVTGGASVGFISEASAALSYRTGRFNSPWWSFAPELRDYTAAPIAVIPVGSGNRVTERFLFAGARLHLRAYNALLQGQFRESPRKLDHSRTENLIVDGWAGFRVGLSGWRITYSVHVSSPEIKHGEGHRLMSWGGITLERNLP
jgi:hypothetical protein